VIVENKVALVTGASEGIGREIILKLVNRGVRCIAVSRHAEDKPFHSAQVQERNCDIGDREQVRQLFEWIYEQYGVLDIIINNAGVWHKAAQLDEIEEEHIDTVLSTNLHGPIHCVKYGLPLLRAAEEAAIVNVVSSAGIHVKAGRSVYGASKFGLRGFTEGLIEDLKETAIHVMGVYQSGTNTQLFAKAGDAMPLDTYIEPADLAEQIVAALCLPPKIWIQHMQINRT
jgi:NAD(P)-dependent dehydrogenase (short-subunit alcohol dehydrogenase family)